MVARFSSRRSARNADVLDRCLRIFTDVRDGEGGGALLLATNVFCLLGSYYLLKTVREALILSEGGVEVKSYAAAAQAMILLLAVPAYGAIAQRANRIRLVNGVTLFFVSHLVVFYQFAVHGVHIGVAFFLWVGIFTSWRSLSSEPSRTISIPASSASVCFRLSASAPRSARGSARSSPHA